MYAKAISELLKQKNIKERFFIKNDDLDNINWSENNKGNITKEEIVTKSNELQIVLDALPKNVKKSSAKSKLLKLGFDEEEIKIIFGEL
tara:strand:- start:16 stop:282 length:267 start_codon:yes stop_codon:yes gene_type:complete